MKSAEYSVRSRSGKFTGGLTISLHTSSTYLGGTGWHDSIKAERRRTSSRSPRRYEMSVPIISAFLSSSPTAAIFALAISMTGEILAFTAPSPARSSAVIESGVMTLPTILAENVFFISAFAYITRQRFHRTSSCSARHHFITSSARVLSPFAT